MLLVLWSLAWLAAAAEQPRGGHPDFSGTWKFNAARSALEVPAPSAATLVIQHREPEVALTRTLVAGGRTTTYSIYLTTDGKPFTRRDGDHMRRSRLYWRRKALVFDTEGAGPEGKTLHIVRYSLADGGRTLIGAEQFRGPGKSHRNRWVFEKEH
jgi:hypothetical protein